MFGGIPAATPEGALIMNVPPWSVEQLMLQNLDLVNSFCGAPSIPTSGRDPSSTTHKPPWSEQGQDCDFYRGHFEQRAKRPSRAERDRGPIKCAVLGLCLENDQPDPVGRFSREAPGQTFRRLGAAQFYFSGRPPATLTARGRGFSHVRGWMLRQQSN